jgi:hypothetical protein
MVHSPAFQGRLLRFRWRLPEKKSVELAQIRHAEKNYRLWIAAG